jgi:hypothetical protein
MISVPKGTASASTLYHLFLPTATFMEGEGEKAALAQQKTYDWCKHKGTAVIGTDRVVLLFFWIYKQSTKLIL